MSAQSSLIFLPYTHTPLRVFKKNFNNSYFTFTKPIWFLTIRVVMLEAQRCDDVAGKNQETDFWSTFRREVYSQIEHEGEKKFFEVSSKFWIFGKPTEG